MTRGKHTSASAQRIWKSKPGSREAHAAAKAAERYAASGGQASGGNATNTHSHGGAYDCQNLNRYGAYCTIWQPCDAHAGNQSGGT
ncbi:hypothetical protein N431DRAFT_427613 [Stipitochalara longipes BDJ]|nr:hypothetical protein N431DRAFT_427613 [Stipitochalara longipes BDJ]